MGRKKGSKNKPKDIPISINLRDTKKEIKILKKLKKQLQPGSKERIEIFRKIKELKTQTDTNIVIDEDKQALIAELQGADPLFERLGIDLRKFSVTELSKHLDNLKRRVK
jgi:chorismate mutase